MDLENIGSVEIKDAISKENAYISVMRYTSYIGIGLSLETDGDVEVYLDLDQTKKIIEWLNLAVSRVEKGLV